MLRRAAAACFAALSALSLIACGGAQPAGGGTTAKAAGARGFSSETTPLYPSKQCETIVPAEDGADPVLRCPARPGYQVQVSFSAWATHVQITGPSTEVSFNGFVGEQLEWRLMNGEPFAVILSVDEQGPDEAGNADPAAKKLQVRGLGGRVIEGEVPAGAPDAAKKAQDLADAAYRAQAQAAPAE